MLGRNETKRARESCCAPRVWNPTHVFFTLEKPRVKEGKGKRSWALAYVKKSANRAKRGFNRINPTVVRVGGKVEMTRMGGKKKEGFCPQSILRLGGMESRKRRAKQWKQEGHGRGSFWGGSLGPDGSGKRRDHPTKNKKQRNFTTGCAKGRCARHKGEVFQQCSTIQTLEMASKV